MSEILIKYIPHVSLESCVQHMCNAATCHRMMIRSSFGGRKKLFAMIVGKRKKYFCCFIIIHFIYESSKKCTLATGPEAAKEKSLPSSCWWIVPSRARTLGLFGVNVLSLLFLKYFYHSKFVSFMKSYQGQWAESTSFKFANNVSKL